MESYLENNENSFFFSFPILKKALRCLLSSLEYKSISLLTSFYWKKFKSLFSKRILSCLMFMGKKVFMKIQNKAFDDWLKLFKRFFFCFKKRKTFIFLFGKTVCASPHTISDYLIEACATLFTAVRLFLRCENII